MERLLTPLLQRFLRKFVKSSEEGVQETFTASLSGGGGIALHHLEFDLSPFFPSLSSSSSSVSISEEENGGGTDSGKGRADGGGVWSLRVERSFARALVIHVPWTALNVQPIEV